MSLRPSFKVNSFLKIKILEKSLAKHEIAEDSEDCKKVATNFKNPHVLPKIFLKSLLYLHKITPLAIVFFRHLFFFQEQRKVWYETNPQ